MRGAGGGNSFRVEGERATLTQRSRSRGNAGLEDRTPLAFTPMANPEEIPPCPSPTFNHTLRAGVVERVVLGCLRPADLVHAPRNASGRGAVQDVRWFVVFVLVANLSRGVVVVNVREFFLPRCGGIMRGRLGIMCGRPIFLLEAMPGALSHATG